MADAEKRVFLRHCLTTTGVLESICCQCGETVGYSRDTQVMKIAEESHICAPRGKAAAAGAGNQKK